MKDSQWFILMAAICGKEYSSRGCFALSQLNLAEERELI